MGKSRLIAEFVRGVRAGGGLVAFGECPAFGTHADYFVWQEIWRTLLRVDPQHERRGATPCARARARRDRSWARRSVRRCSGPCSGSRSRTTTSPPASTRSCGRRRSRACSRSACGRAPPRSSWWSCSRTATGSTPLSRDLLAALVRASASLPVLFVLAYRPAATPGGDLGLESPDPVRRADAGRARAGGRRAADPLQAGAALRGRGDGVPAPRPARHRALAGQPASTSRSCSASSRPGHRSPDDEAAAQRSSCPRACTA